MQQNMVQRAIQMGVTNIGQLTKSELEQLEQAVKIGILSKTKTYNYPIPKNIYVRNINYEV